MDCMLPAGWGWGWGWSGLKGEGLSGGWGWEGWEGREEGRVRVRLSLSESKRKLQGESPRKVVKLTSGSRERAEVELARRGVWAVATM